MRNAIATFALLPFLIVPTTSAFRAPSVFAPFSSPEDNVPQLSSNESLIEGGGGDGHALLKQRQFSNGCPTNFNPCTQNGYAGACCTVGSFCTTDAVRNVACCPTGATCTGTLNGGLNTGKVTTTTSNVFGSPVTTGPVTVVTNPYFPFPVIATTYPNSAACNTAYQACQTNYAACTANLQGGGYGVTVVAPNGGGITLVPTAQNLGPASATSICSSLSQQACFGIVSDSCLQFGNGGSFVVSQTGNRAARPTVGCMAAVGVAAGVGLGIAGQLV